MEKYLNKYRIGSHRLPGWDYSSEGMYFLTIVTQYRECNLGQIENGIMTLSDFGRIVETELLKSFDIRAELFLDEYVIMPNHLHLLVVIQKNDDIKMGGDHDAVNTHGRAYIRHRRDGDGSMDKTDGHDMDKTDGHETEETHGRASLRFRRDGDGSMDKTNGHDMGKSENDIKPIVKPEKLNVSMPIRQPKSISSFLAGFKSAVNSRIDDYIDQHQLNIPKYNRKNHFFQPNYHDQIVWDDRAYYYIKRYIQNNPLNWDADKFIK
jgi:REP element-mobilizing transposase RayT